MPTQPRTAEAAYAERHVQALALLAELTAMVEDLPAPDAIKVNWGHVGSLAEVNRQLDETREFLASM